ncbi:MAG: hypothetical protein K9M45_11230 [Kiritimatiellales bacterium]|nr:hypothetical protein [Kiritimatiellales bacterium]
MLRKESTAGFQWLELFIQWLETSFKLEAVIEAELVAPVMLSQDATVTGLRLYYYDDSLSYSLSISGYLSRSRVTSTRSVVQLATIGSTTSTGDDNTIDYVEDTTQR